MIMTGQAQRQIYSQRSSRAVFAAASSHLFDWPGRDLHRRAELLVVRRPQHFRSDRSARKNFVPPNNFSPGGPGDIVVVRVFYQWPLFVTGMGFNLSNLAGSKRLLTATAAFQNEPSF